MRDGGSAHIANRHVLGSDYYNTTRKKRLRLIKSGWRERTCNSARIAAAIARALARGAPLRRDGIRSSPQVLREVRMAQWLLDDTVCSATAPPRRAGRARGRCANARAGDRRGIFARKKNLHDRRIRRARRRRDARRRRIRIGDSVVRRGASDVHAVARPAAALDAERKIAGGAAARRRARNVKSRACARAVRSPPAGSPYRPRTSSPARRTSRPVPAWPAPARPCRDWRPRSRRRSARSPQRR